MSALETFFVFVGNKRSRNYRKAVTFKHSGFCIYYYMRHLVVIVQFLKGEKWQTVLQSKWLIFGMVRIV